MAYRLPPLNALRAFEAAARHLSFSKAADELHVTPAAISHQIKGLEEYLGVQLFKRLNRALRLTDEAQACLPKLREGFDSLSEAVERVRNLDRSGTLSVSVAPSFAAKWLVPRLHHFADRHPEIDIRITASMDLIDVRNQGMGPVDFRRDDVDMAIRFGTGRYPGLRVDKLLSVSLVPLCSPRLVEQESHPLKTPADLRHHTLLHDDTVYWDEGRADWKLWLQAAGVEGVDASRGPRFSHTILALESAIEGQGVALSLRTLADADIKSGRLVVPFEFAIPVNFAYYVVCPEASADRPAIAAFRDWLLEEAQLDQTSPPKQIRA